MHTEYNRYNRQGLAAAKFMCLPSYNVILIQIQQTGVVSASDYVRYNVQIMEVHRM